MYEVKFPDGDAETFSVNAIAENIFSQVDGEGRAYSILDEIIGHRKKDDALDIEDVNPRNRVTAKGWDVEVQWRDGTTSWLPMRELNEK